MRINKWYILAGGSATRWKGYQGVKNKCYLKIDGETLIDRTIRLLEENGQNNYEVVLEGYGSKREAFEGIARKEKGPFGILLGDCYYTEAIIKDAVKRDVDIWTHYYNCWPNYWTGCTWEEGYIHLVPDWEWWLEKMTEFNKQVESGKIDFRKDFQIDRFLRGYDAEEYRPNTLDEHDVFWCDETDDFDYPEDYDKFMARHEANRAHTRRDMLSIIIPTYNNWKTLQKLLETLVYQKTNTTYPFEVIVIDDGSTEDIRAVVAGFGPFVKAIYQPNRGVSNARNVGLMASTGKYITFVDSDDSVAGNYVQVVAKEMEQGCDYCIFPWRHLDKGQDMFGVYSEKLVPWAAVWAYAFTWECIGDNRFDENLNVAEDLTWLKQVITEDKKRGISGDVIYIYDWNANPDSLTKLFNRGDIKMLRKEVEDGRQND